MKKYLILVIFFSKNHNILLGERGRRFFIIISGSVFVMTPKDGIKMREKVIIKTLEDDINDYMEVAKEP